jgi:hypothetical protein
MRVGLLDIAAAGALAAALILPSPSRDVKPLFMLDTSLAPALADAQADAWRHRADGRAIARLSDLLVRARQTDWAIRAAVAGADEVSPSAWRAMVAASAAHADRAEYTPAFDWADRALAACVAPGSDCAEDERTRLGVYVAALKAAVQSGADPYHNAKAFDDAIKTAVPLIRLGRPR